MTWVGLTLITAFLASTKDVIGKKILGRVDELVVAWAWHFFSILFLWPFVSFKDFLEVNKIFWIALAVSGSLLVVSTVLYVKAIKASDLSISIPILSFSPLFLLI